MRFVIIGAGLAGVAAAWRLAREGHDVCTLDANESPALETSFANGGQVLVAEATPWIGPRVWGTIASGLFSRDAAFRLGLRLDPDQWRWLARCALQTLPDAYAQATRRMLALATLSRALFVEDMALLRQDNSPADCGAAAPSLAQSEGILRLWSDTRASDAAHTKLAKAIGETRARELIKPLSQAACVEREGALADAARAGLFTHGLLEPGAFTANAYAYALRAADRARRAGARFVWGRRVVFLGRAANGTITHALDDHGDSHTADVFLLANGVHAPTLARTIGARPLIWSVMGASLTLPADPLEAAPQLGLTWEARRVVLTRLDDTVRIAGLARVGARATKPTPQVQQAMGASLARAAATLLPSLAPAPSPLMPWIGLRPMTPDCSPLVGALQDKQRQPSNLWINAGHGSLGWTLCHASAALLADIAAQRSNPLINDFNPQRFG